MVNTRPTWDLYMMHIAQSVSERADCTRRKVGAVIMDTEHRIVSTGYNGAPSGMPGCASDGACPRGRHYGVIITTGEVPTIPSEFTDWHACACGNPWPCPDAAVPGSSYDTGPGSCIAVHAEANALLYARRSLVGCTMYVTDRPCDGCKRLIRASKLADCVYWDSAGMLWAYDCEYLVQYPVMNAYG